MFMIVEGGDTVGEKESSEEKGRKETSKEKGSKEKIICAY